MSEKKNVWRDMFIDLDEDGNATNTAPKIKSDHRVNAARASRLKASNPEFIEKLTTSIKKRFDDPEYVERNKTILQDRAKDPNWLEKTRANNKSKAVDSKWLALIKQKNQEQSKDPEWIRKKAEGMKDLKTKNPEWYIKTSENNRKNALKQSKHIQTRHGAFVSKNAAAEFYGVDPSMIGYWIKNKSTEFYLISEEEYAIRKENPIKPIDETTPHPSKKIKK